MPSKIKYECDLAYASGSQVPNAERYYINKKPYVMKHNYSVSVNKTTFIDGTYKETSRVLEIPTDSFLTAYDEYQKMVSKHAEHVAELTYVKLDVVIQLAIGDKILNRIKLSN
jgi:hypothetical protein